MPDSTTEIKYGTAYLFGVGGESPTNMTIVSESLSVKPNISESVTDEFGRTVHVRMDDFVEEASLEGFVKGSDAGAIPTLPSSGLTIMWRGNKYIVNEHEYRGEAKGFAKYSIKGIRYLSTGIPE